MTREALTATNEKVPCIRRHPIDLVADPTTERCSVNVIV